MDSLKNCRSMNRPPSRKPPRPTDIPNKSVKELSLRVFGNDYLTPDGSCIRDYLHVVDLAKAHLAAMKRLEEDRQKNNYEVFNLGTGKGVSVFEAIQAFERVSGEKLNYKVYPRRSGDIEKIWADPTLANTELGWKARSSLEEAMETAWNWEVYYRKGTSGT